MSGTAFDALQSIVRGTALLSLAALVVAGLLAALNIRASTIRWRAWFAVLLCGLGFAPLTLRLPWLSPLAAPLAASNGERSPAPPATVELHQVDSSTDELPDETTAEAEPQPGDTPASLVANQTEPRTTTPLTESPTSNWPSILLGVWIAGMAAILARGVWRYLRFLRSMRLCSPAPQDWSAEWQAVLASQQVNRPVPMLVGEGYGPALCRLPRGYALVVPRGMWEQTSSDARDVILRHELAHYRRNDLVWSLIARWLAAPHWFNPLAHLAVRRLDEASEWACDDAATGGQAAQQLILSKTLLGLSETPGAPGAMQAAVGGRSLAMRIRRLLEPALPQERKMKRVIVAAALLVCLAAGGVRLELIAQEKEKPQENIASATTAAVPTVAREELRYDGKSFEEWQRVFQTELKLSRRTEAVWAMDMFAQNGYSKESIETLVAVLNDIRQPQPNEEYSEFSAAIRDSIAAVDASVTAPLLLKLVSETKNVRGQRIALIILSRKPAREHVSADDFHRIAIDKNRDMNVRSFAVEALLQVEPDQARALDALRTLIADSEGDSQHALRNWMQLAVIEQANPAPIPPGDVREKSKHYLVRESLLPLLIDGLHSDNEEVRMLASRQLGHSGAAIKKVLPELLKLAANDKEIVGQMAGAAVRTNGNFSPAELQACFDDLALEQKLTFLKLQRDMAYSPWGSTDESWTTFFAMLKDDESEEIRKSAAELSESFKARNPANGDTPRVAE